VVLVEESVVFTFEKSLWVKMKENVEILHLQLSPLRSVCCDHSIHSMLAFNILGITWVLVYRTDKYKRLKAEVEKQSKKCKY
jgi:hypothetical protein